MGSGRLVRTTNTGAAAVALVALAATAACGRADDARQAQNSIACNATMLPELGYSESLEGLGATAYVAEMGDGTHVLVGRDNTPFELRVDLADAARARDAATTLARQVLAGS